MVCVCKIISKALRGWSGILLWTILAKMLAKYDSVNGVWKEALESEARYLSFSCLLRSS